MVDEEEKKEEPIDGEDGVKEEEKSLFDLTGVKESGEIPREKHPKTIYSTRRVHSNFNSNKRTKYTIRLYDVEYEILRVQAKELGISIQRLLDYFLIEGFIKRDKRIIDFIKEQIENDVKVLERGIRSIDKFSSLEISKMIDEIERKEKKGK